MASLPTSLSNFLRQFVFVIVASLGAATMFTATAASAGKPVYYEATLASPAKTATKVVKGVVWHCKETTCKASESRTRDAYVCAKLARKMGDVTAFTVKGVAFDDAALAECNGKK